MGATNSGQVRGWYPSGAPGPPVSMIGTILVPVTPPVLPTPTPILEAFLSASVYGGFTFPSWGSDGNVGFMDRRSTLAPSNFNMVRCGPDGNVSALVGSPVGLAAGGIWMAGSSFYEPYYRVAVWSQDMSKVVISELTNLAVPGANPIMVFDNTDSSTWDGHIQLALQGTCGPQPWSPGGDVVWADGGTVYTSSGGAIGSGTRPSWGPDGTIAIATSSGIQLVGHGTIAGGRNVTCVCWSPTGDRLAFTDDNGLWIISAGGGVPTQVVASTPTSYLGLDWVDWHRGADPTDGMGPLIFHARPSSSVPFWVYRVALA